MNYLSKNIASLNPAERKILLNIIKSQKLEKIMQGTLAVSSLRLTNRVKNILKKALALSDQAKKFEASERNIKIEIKNLNPAKDKPSDNAVSVLSNDAQVKYTYQRYVLDSSCNSNCEFTPVEEKDVNTLEPFQEKLALKPYSVQMIILKKKPKESESLTLTEQPAVGTTSTTPPESAAPAEAKSIETNAGNK
jgi:hypothetical protein